MSYFIATQNTGKCFELLRLFFLIGLFPSRCVHTTNFIELNRLYTTQLAVVILQLVTSAICFGLIWPSSGLQSLVSIIT